MAARKKGIRRNLRQERVRSSALPTARFDSGIVHPGRDRAARAPAEALADGPGHHVHGVRREGGHRTDLPVRLRAARDPLTRVGTPAGRAGPAGHGPQPLHPRRVSGSEVPQGPHRASRDRAVSQGVQARAPERDSAAPDLHPRGRHRHHPGRSRRVPRARGQLPLSLGRVVRPREPQYAQSSLSGILQVLSRPPDQGLPDPAPRNLAARRAAIQREAGRGDPDARHGELRVLRTLVPGTRDGRGARRGP